MRSRYIKEAFIAIVLLVFTTEISAQNFKHIKVTGENHISEIKSLYIKTAFLDGLPNIKDEAYGYIVKDNDGYGYLLINQKKLRIGSTIPTNKNPYINDKPYVVGYIELEGKKIPIIVLANSVAQLMVLGF